MDKTRLIGYVALVVTLTACGGSGGQQIQGPGDPIPGSLDGNAGGARTIAEMREDPNFSGVSFTGLGSAGRTTATSMTVGNSTLPAAQSDNEFELNANISFGLPSDGGARVNIQQTLNGGSSVSFNEAFESGDELATPGVVPRFGGFIEFSLHGFASLARNDGSGASLDYLLPGTSIIGPDSRFDFVTMAYWSLFDEDVRDSGFFVAGIETANDAMPTTGTASYQLFTRGKLLTDQEFFTVFGEGELSVDFASGSLTGHFGTLHSQSSRFFDAPTLGEISVEVFLDGFEFTADIATGTNLFEGITTGLGRAQNATGTVVGAFFGPGAAELGGTWTLSNGDSTAGGYTAFGAFIGGDGDILGLGSLSDYIDRGSDGLRGPSGVGFETSSAGIEIETVKDEVEVAAQNIGDKDAGEKANVSFASNRDAVVLDINVGGTGGENIEVDVTFEVADIVANAGGFTTYQKVNGTETFELVLLNPDEDGFGAGTALSAATLGAWSQDNPDDDELEFGYFVLGIKTAANDMPTTGQATYNVNTMGKLVDGGARFDLNGAGTFTADFATGNVQGSFPGLTATDEFGADTAIGGFTSSASIATGDNLFSGTTAGTGTLAGTTGAVEGGFFGDQAAEIGGTWTLSNGDSSLTGTNAVGGFVGKQ